MNLCLKTNKQTNYISNGGKHTVKTISFCYLGALSDIERYVTFNILSAIV